MKILKDWKALLISLALSTVLVGETIHLFSANALLKTAIPPHTGNSIATNEAAKPGSSQSGTTPAIEGLPMPSQKSTLVTKPSSKERRSPANQPLPGYFRGDWGPQPVYAKNDRVNFDRAAYLSLVDDNQNQPPANSQGYWRLVKKFKALHEENCFNPMPDSDMSECDFSAETDTLKDRDLRKANLVKARLNGELGASDLSEANLSGAAVLGKLIIGPDTRMAGANLSYLQSEGNNPVIGENANLSGVNFTKANLYGAKFSHADLSRGKFPEAVLTGSDLASVDLNNADLSKADMTYGNLAESKLTQALLSGANLEEADLRHADVSQAKLQQANLANVQLEGVNFSGTDLRGANFLGAHGADTAVVDAQTNFTAAICPDGVTVDGTQVTTCVGHGF